MSRPSGRLRTALLLLVVLALAVGVAVLAVDVRAESRREVDREVAVEAARDAATALTSLDHADSDAGVDRVLALATGDLAQQFGDSRDRLRTLLGSRRSRSEGTVLEAGLASFTGEEAEVLLAVDASVTDADTAQPRVQRYRMAITVRRVGDGWRAERVLFAGAPAEGVLP